MAVVLDDCALIESVLPALLRAFAGNIKELYRTRPWWLVNEALVRGEFISSLLPVLVSQRRSLANLSASDICTEDRVGSADKIDLVCRFSEAVGPLVVEFKGWNIVAKCPDGKAFRASNAAAGYVQAQLVSIRKDARKLASIQTQATRVLVAHAQEALPAELAFRHAGRKRKQPLGFSIAKHVNSAEAFLSWWKDNDDGGSRVELSDLGAAEADMICSSGSKFVLRAFLVGKFNSSGDPDTR